MDEPIVMVTTPQIIAHQEIMVKLRQRLAHQEIQKIPIDITEQVVRTGNLEIKTEVIRPQQHVVTARQLRQGKRAATIARILRAPTTQQVHVQPLAHHLALAAPLALLMEWAQVEALEEAVEAVAAEDNCCRNFS